MAVTFLDNTDKDELKKYTDDKIENATVEIFSCKQTKYDTFDHNIKNNNGVLSVNNLVTSLTFQIKEGMTYKIRAEGTFNRFNISATTDEDLVLSKTKFDTILSGDDSGVLSSSPVVDGFYEYEFTCGNYKHAILSLGYDYSALDVVAYIEEKKTEDFLVNGIPVVRKSDIEDILRNILTETHNNIVE